MRRPLLASKTDGAKSSIGSAASAVRVRSSSSPCCQGISSRTTVPHASFFAADCQSDAAVTVTVTVIATAATAASAAVADLVDLADMEDIVDMADLMTRKFRTGATIGNRRPRDARRHVRATSVAPAPSRP